MTDDCKHCFFVCVSTYSMELLNAWASKNGISRSDALDEILTSVRQEADEA